MQQQVRFACGTGVFAIAWCVFTLDVVTCSSSCNRTVTFVMHVRQCTPA